MDVEEVTPNEYSFATLFEGSELMVSSVPFADTELRPLIDESSVAKRAERHWELFWGIDDR